MTEQILHKLDNQSAKDKFAFEFDAQTLSRACNGLQDSPRHKTEQTGGTFVTQVEDMLHEFSIDNSSKGKTLVDKVGELMLEQQINSLLMGTGQKNPDSGTARDTTHQTKPAHDDQSPERAPHIEHLDTLTKPTDDIDDSPRFPNDIRELLPPILQRLDNPPRRL